MKQVKAYFAYIKHKKQTFDTFIRILLCVFKKLHYTKQKFGMTNILSLNSVHTHSVRIVYVCSFRQDKELCKHFETIENNAL